MKYCILTISFLLTGILLSQENSHGVFVVDILNFECDEIVDQEYLKNNRLIGFEKTELGYTANFIFRLTCCAEYEIKGQYSSDSLFLTANQTNNLSCDCQCYYKTTILLPTINPELIYWHNQEYIGLQKTEYIEYPISFEIFQEDTINFFDKFKKAQGKFVYGTNLENPDAVIYFENDSLVSGWGILEYHTNRTPRILKTYNKHDIGDRAIYTYLDSNQNIIKRCYRYFPNPLLQYVEFCLDSTSDLVGLPNSENLDFITFLNDSLTLKQGEISHVNYDNVFQEALSSEKITYIILLESSVYSDAFSAKLEAIKGKRLEVFRKELKWL